MILKEATIGGVVYLDWVKSEMALPEKDRVAFEYGAISEGKRQELLNDSIGVDKMPDPAKICKAAIDDLGKKIRNLKAEDGTVIDTVEKLLARSNDLMMTYLLYTVGRKIWVNQSGGSVDTKNLK